MLPNFPYHAFFFSNSYLRALFLSLLQTFLHLPLLLGLHPVESYLLISENPNIILGSTQWFSTGGFCLSRDIWQCLKTFYF